MARFSMTRWGEALSLFQAPHRPRDTRVRISRKVHVMAAYLADRHASSLHREEHLGNAKPTGGTLSLIVHIASLRVGVGLHGARGGGHGAPRWPSLLALITGGRGGGAATAQSRPVQSVRELRPCRSCRSILATPSQRTLRASWQRPCRIVKGILATPSQRTWQWKQYVRTYVASETIRTWQMKQYVSAYVRGK